MINYILSNLFIFLIFIFTLKFKIISYKKNSIGGLFFLLFIFINIFNFDNFLDFRLLILLTLIFIIGILDDFFNLSVILRFCIITIFLSIYFIYFNTNDLGVSIFIHQLNIFLVIFLILGFIHTLNMIDGIDGLYFSFIIIFCTICFLFTKEKLFIGIMINLFLLLILNLKKYIIAGNSGNYLISTFFAFIAFSLNQKAEFNFLDKQIIFDERLVITIFTFPILDGLRVSLQRLFNKKSPFKGDLSHIHHYAKNKMNCLIVLSFSQICVITQYLIFQNIILSILFSLILYMTYLHSYKKNSLNY